MMLLQIKDSLNTYTHPNTPPHFIRSCNYEIIPEQRYDLSNHLVWMQKRKPGGQGYYKNIFSEDTIENYKKDLINSWHCDTMFIELRKS